MYTADVIKTLVQNNINNSDFDLLATINKGIEYLNNFFYQEIIDNSIKTVASQNYIARPANCQAVTSVYIELERYEQIYERQLDEAREYELKRFLDSDSKIIITPTPSLVMDCEIFYKGDFTPLASLLVDTVTDVPNRLIPVLVSASTWFYYEKLLAVNITAREDLPDVKPAEMKELAEYWQKNTNEMIKIMQ